MQAVIQAGGKGTRLSSVTRDEIPKPMIPIAGKPLLEWQMEALRRCGIHAFVFVVGHLGGRIREHFGDGSTFGVSIRYLEETEPLGTAGALALLPEYLADEEFLFVYGDVLFDIDVDRMRRYHRQQHAAVTLFAHPNSHPFDSDLIFADGDGRVTGFDSKHNDRSYWCDNLVNAGFYLCDRRICGEVPSPRKLSFEADILAEMAKRGEAVYAYRSTEYIKDAGTPDRLGEVEKAVRSGLVAARNLSRKQRCVFLDRDGTLTKYNGLVYSPDQLELEATAAKAVRALNESGWLAVCVTNQPVVARGLCSEDEVRGIHRKLQTLLGREGAYLDDIIFCPHHPDKGYPEENPAYKMACDCRKPSTGMIDRMAERYNIDPVASWMVGDTTVDIQTGKNAGLRTVLVTTGEGGRDGKYPVKSDAVCDDIVSCVEKIISEADYVL